jgi:hypothetical protein
MRNGPNQHLKFICTADTYSKQSIPGAGGLCDGRCPLRTCAIPESRSNLGENENKQTNLQSPSWCWTCDDYCVAVARVWPLVLEPTLCSIPTVPRLHEQKRHIVGAAFAHTHGPHRITCRDRTSLPRQVCGDVHAYRLS